MRAFLAFEVADEVAARLLAAEEELKQTDADLSLVARENIHFTVKFLGDVPDSATEEIDLRMKKLKLRAIEVAIRGLGVFPNFARPRVVWAGVAEEDQPEMKLLSKSIIDALEGVGDKEDHDFHAHITLGRVKGSHKGDAMTSYIMTNRARDFGRTRIDSLKLKSSTLTPAGPIYTDLREYALN